MKILSVEVYKCKRLMDGGTTYLKASFNQSIQIILGTNGSGKSSLLRLLSPLPAPKQMFVTGGYCKVFMEHKGRYYYCRSVFDNGALFYFGVSDEYPHTALDTWSWIEMNEGKTQTSQKILSKEFFNLTPEIHELLLSSIRFHELNAHERQKYLTMLSDVNYDYATSVYKQLMERLRDVKGAIKVTNKSISQASIQILSDDEVNHIQDHCKKLEDFLAYFLEIKTPVTKSTEEHFAFLTKTASAIKEHYNSFNRLFRQYSIRGMGVEDLNYQIAGSETLIQEYEEQIKTINAEHDNAALIMDEIEQVDTSSYEALQLRETGFVNAIAALTSSVDTAGFVIVDPAQSNTMARWLRDQITPVLLELPVNENEYYGSIRFNELQREIEGKSTQLLDVKTKYAEIATRLAQMKELMEHDATTCPNCNHSWREGYDDVMYNNLTQRNITLFECMGELTAMIELATTQLEEIKKYNAQIAAIKNLKLCSQNDLKGYWDYVQQQGLIKNNPGSALSVLDRYITTCEHLIHHKYLSSSLGSVREDMRAIENAKKQDKDLISRTLKITEEKLSQLSIKLIGVRKNREFLLRQRNICNTLTQLVTTVDNLAKLYRNAHDQAALDIRATLVNTIVRDLQIAIGEKQKQIANCRLQKAIVEENERKAASLKEEQVVLEHITHELSPTTGIIGEGMHGFMELFFQQVTDFIQRMWAYPMIVKPCQPDDLDYKFPIIRPETNAEITDIALGSGAMREVISLAVKILSMRHLGMDHFPVPLDEFGTSFDSTHRQAAINLTNSLLTVESFSQLFIVSHFEDQIVTLTDSEIMVLCPMNIVIPPGAIANKHVEKY